MTHEYPTDCVNYEDCDRRIQKMQFSYKLGAIHWPMSRSRVSAPRRRATLRGLSPQLRLVQTFPMETRHKIFNLKSTSKHREPSQHCWCSTVVRWYITNT
ncbi:hypothetical protein EVAR_46789_1 [Eumeta japonica]|uniref:Uncharacterized protein n=1 Tax=Eumeta variegata TaxID=151549 RepID=A0A4C1XCI6_EUMVA|nr:hypothetical protein EVAR_46789_1 [Eumeta japonica]